MDHVWFAGRALLALVPHRGEAKRLFERSKIFVGPLLAEVGFEFAVLLLDSVGGYGRVNWHLSSSL
jgi:hypothetical protein